VTRALAAVLLALSVLWNARLPLVPVPVPVALGAVLALSVAGLAVLAAAEVRRFRSCPWPRSACPAPSCGGTA